MVDDDLLIRGARPADAVAIAGVLAAAFEPYAALYTPDAFAATTPPAPVLSERLREGPTWIAVSDATVGTVSSVARDTGSYIRSMAVLPTHRGRGIGRALLDAVEGFARQSGSPRLYLSTTPFLVEAIRLYEARGYMRTDEPPFDLFGTPLFTMEKRLTDGPRPRHAHP